MKKFKYEATDNEDGIARAFDYSNYSPNSYVRIRRIPKFETQVYELGECTN